MTAFSFPVCWYCIFQALVLLLLANGAPILLNNIAGHYWLWPIDNGCKLRDGQRIFGETKTWRGVLSAVCSATVGAYVFGLSAWIGVTFGLLSMSGDLLSSFIKRRSAKIESSQARGLDTVPEALLPIAFLQQPLQLGLFEMVSVVSIFFLIEEYISPILYRLHIRKRPY